MIAAAKDSIVLCTNIEMLDFSFNDISAKGFEVFLDLVSKKNCNLIYFNISHCAISLNSLGKFIKLAKKLHTLIA